MERDFSKALPYMEESAKLNNRKSQELLSKMYFLGIAVKKNTKIGEYRLEQSKLPEEITEYSQSELPKILIFEYNSKKLQMLLSSDEKYYVGNILAKEGDLSWLGNKWVQTLGTGAVCAGAVTLGIVGLPVAIAAGIKALSLIFSDSNENNTAPKKVVNIQLCKQLKEETGYNFSVSTETELKGVGEDKKTGCIVLRVDDNPRLALATS